MTPDPNQQPAEETTERGAPRSPRKKHRPSILGYLIVLFIAAFFLLLLSYFMQQRRSDQNLIDGLQENASAMETVIVGAIVLAVLCLAIRSMIKSHKKGGCSACGGGCGGACGHCSDEHH